MTTPIGNSRNNIGLVHKWYMHPHNDGYHAIHHMYSKVPFHQLPNAHHMLLKSDDEYLAKAVNSYSMMQTFLGAVSKPTTMRQKPDHLKGTAED